MIHFQNITEYQAKRLQHLAKLINTLCPQEYTIGATFHTVPGRKGFFYYICRTKETSARVSRLVRRICPCVKLHRKSGNGWHYLDATPYHEISFDFNIL